MPVDEFEQRRRAVASLLPERKVDRPAGPVLPNVRYLTGYTGS